MENFKQFRHGNCFSYLIVSRQGKAILVDPHFGLVDTYLDYLKKNKISLANIIDTHTHADHISAAAILKNKLNIPVLMHEKSISNVATKRLTEGSLIQFDDVTVKVLYTPGHTDEIVSLLYENRLITADTLLINSIGRTDFQNGNPGLAFDSLKKLSSLPEETEIYPGHDYKGNFKSSIKLEKQNNFFLNYNDRDKFIADMRAMNIPKPANMDYIVKVNQDGTAGSLKKITAEDLINRTKRKEMIAILDVRSSSELSEVKTENAIHIPLNELPLRISELKNIDGEIITLCRTGNRATIAAQALLQAGFSNVSLIEGGIIALEKSGYPLIKSKLKWSIERQVRFLAGTIVLVFSLLALFINQWFALGSLFIGGGLIFAGITNKCGMAALLLKLPYNKLDLPSQTEGGTCAME
ncbi:MAG: hypothetical protein A3C43_08725 [Candidatus Schekmanbacteria bacterium RIFCSPHIGHO2_02_FULL_38_11]|nr:MAG: hypothetical protein A3C43_08725 [Candidatus Schekmanbacteria bacterium RIFCSPHIGHO2_02_FULL_38_11]OGL49317.1 MAG: hypothetical protein A3H37_07690 [Candidatus Schekmanbacteria bacterium RIFCSPLOWO2_02_FULL_38_14]